MDRIQVQDKLRDVLTAPGLSDPRYAIVLPVVCGDNGADLLIEVRAPGIPQAGDPCFPGGRIEPGETPACAAARELEEELGICASPEDFLGRLPAVHTILGSKTDVFVCTVTPEDAEGVRLNAAEVSELLRIPVSFFLRRPGAASFPAAGHVIWGMTAGAIRHFCDAWRRAGL